MNVLLKDFSDPAYFLAKLRREIDRLQKAQDTSQDSDVVRDHGVNAAITAWHLPEWVLRANNSSADVNGYRNGLISKNTDFALMHDIATHVKHLKITSPQNPVPFEVRTSARAVYTESEQTALDKHFISSNEPLYMRLQNPFQTILKIDERDALPLFESIYQFLKNEFFPS